MAQRSLHLQNRAADQKRNLKHYQISRYERMKTIFGHSLIEEGYNAPIYNVMFDQTGSFVISGADDGIIKIWDKETLNLQASLHSHNEVITDIDISKCNNYLATASKDGKLIIWDWKNCQKVDEIAAHNSTINNIKFFQVKQKAQNSQSKESTKIQILVSCSEDGTIKIFDELNFLQASNNNPTVEQMGKRSKRHEQQQNNKRERYCLCVTPDDYRPGPGQRNKKIESINVSQTGLIAAGTNTGEVFLWRLDLQKFRQQQQKAYIWLGSSKKHNKTVHFCEFSPNGKYLFTGSVDGTAKIWNVEIEKTKKGQELALGLTDNRLAATLEEKRFIKDIDNQIFFRDRNGLQVNYGDHKQSKNSWQCDTISWSCHGRYAICALSGKVDSMDKDQSQELSILKIWDSFTGRIIQDLGKENNIQLLNFSFVIAPHPIIEEIFLSGSDGGTICLWNIRTRKLMKKFLEYGVYSYEKYTMSDPYDGKFSPDGSCFVVGSVMGTISLFSNEGAKYKYEATRVEQFFPNDDQKHLLNIYYDKDDEPQICGYSLIPYEVQPPSSLLGKFRNARRLTNEEYERNLLVRQELCKEEEDFIQGQLEEGLRNNFFNNNEQQPFDLFRNDLDDLALQQIEQEQPNNQRRDNNAQRARINSQFSQISNNNNNLHGSQEEQELLNRINDAERLRRNRGRGRRTNIATRVQEQQMRRLTTNFDPDNSYFDRSSDENFEEENFEISEEDSEEDDFEEEESEDYRVNKRQNRENYHSTMQDRRQIQTRNTNQDQNIRSTRTQRRHNRVENSKTNNDDDELEYRGKKSRRRAVLQSEDSSQVDISEDDDYQLSDADDENQPKRRLKRNNDRGDTYDLLESEDEEDDEDDQSEYGVRTRKARNERKQQRLESRRNQRAPAKSNLRSRDTRRKYDDRSQSEDNLMDYEEEKESKPFKNTSQEEKPGSQGKRNKRLIKEEDSEQDIVDQDVIIPTENGKKQKGDEDFELVVKENQIQLDVDMMQDNSKKCDFCLRQDPPIIGPFVRTQKIQRADQNTEYYFHKDCIEVNDFSFFNSKKSKWMNLGKAIEKFSKVSLMCTRCFAIGATIKCTTCHHRYHGFLCSQLYMVFTGQSYQCFECRNKENFKSFKDKDQLIEKQELKIIKRNIPRDHLLAAKQSKISYIPQINDLVYYFFQGHEKFISYFNCFFYAGDSETIDFEYPWRVHEELVQPTLCRVINVHYSFPSKNALYLIKRFGKISSVIQIPQIISHLELQVVNTPDKKFNVDLFPNELPDFLVLKNLYENSLFFYEKLLGENKLIGETFQARVKHFNKVKIVGVLERESLLQEPTHWENTLYRHVESYRLRERGRRGQRRDQDEQEPSDIMNFWELVLDQQFENDDSFIGLVSAFDDSEIERIIGIIKDYCARKKDQTLPFMERVPEKIAPDYRQHVSAEMYMDLIVERLINKYYRTQEVTNQSLIDLQQLFSDLDLICYNAKIYNGEDHQLYKDSKKMVEALRCEIKKNINYSDDQKKQKLEEYKGVIPNQKPVGKLTAPIFRTDMNVSSMDQFRQNLMRQNQPMEEMKNTVRINRRNKENEQIINQEADVKIEISESSDQKITPNPKNMIEGNRRLTRNQNASNKQLETFNEGQYSTGEKVVRQFQRQEQESENIGQLGKRTRSGRQTRQMKNTLNEDDSDREFEKLLNGNDDEKMIGQQPNRRIRQN